MTYVLASGSPRRRELLGQLLGDLPFSVDPAVRPEPDAAGLPPRDAVLRIARAKAEEVAARHGADDTVIAADTLVYLDGAPLGKPRDGADAARMLRALSGRAHEVLTGVSAARSGRFLDRCAVTKVTFRHLTEEEIVRYVATGEPMDKAGAYGIQGRAGVMIASICGDYYNVVGLPLCTLWEMLRDLGALPGQEGSA